MLSKRDPGAADGTCESEGVEIASLHTYPVKGCHRIDHDQAGVEPWGLAGDRRWMVVDADGVGITQRTAPLLTGLRVVAGAGGIVLTAPGMPRHAVPEPVAGPKQFVRVFNSLPPVPARVASASDWFSAFLGRPARLVWLGDPTVRPIEDHAQHGDRVSFADGFPLLLTTTASLSAVNDWLVEAGDEPVPMTRFRPSIVVSGAAPWAEDQWLGHRLRIGEVTFRAAKACARCVVTTIDQETGEAGRQPLHILGQNRRVGTELLFGLGLIPDIHAGESGIVRVGDAVLRLP
jgi:uncharacterized protein YcbX